MGISVCINGRVGDEKDACISVFDRGFLYGDSVFEVMRTYGGKPYACTEHLERLERSATRLMISMPASLGTLTEEIGRALQASENPDSYVRVIITRGSGPLTYDPSTASNPARVIIAAPLNLLPPSAYRDGVGVTLVRASRPTDDPRAAGVKASNYLSNLLALHEAKRHGSHEAVLLSPAGDVLEGASSNVFVVRYGALRTPRVEAGILEGITRGTVVRAAREDGLAVIEDVLYPRDLYEADEVFITSTLREVVPVTRVDGRSVASGRPGPMARRIRRLYRGEVARSLGVLLQDVDELADLPSSG